MATLTQLTASIQSIIQDDSYTDLTDRINDAISNIAGGIRMPDGQTSSPLADLYVCDTIDTDSGSSVSLFDNYQRNVFNVIDSSGEKIYPPKGGDYYSFMLFLNQCYKKDLTETGSVTDVCVKGRTLVYQGIPSSPETLTVMYYKKPTTLVSGDDEPTEIPDHLQTRLIKHYVCMEIFGEGLEDGAESRKVGTTYHTQKFFEAMTDLIDYNGMDAEPQFYNDGVIGY